MKKKLLLCFVAISIVVALIVSCNFEDGIFGGVAKFSNRLDETYWKAQTVLIPGRDVKEVYRGGCFFTGRDVSITEYSMSRYEVTQGQYQNIMGDNPSYVQYHSDETKFKGPKKPVNNISWYDAIAFCNLYTISESGESDCVYYSNEAKTEIYTKNDAKSFAAVYWDTKKNGYRLPTEAEWEHAARGGNPNARAWSFEFSGSDNKNDVAWHRENSDRTIHDVGTKMANTAGYYDMSGNVWEWCWDWQDNIEPGNVINPTGPSDENQSQKIVRGGHFMGGSLGVASRVGYDPRRKNQYIGFRICKTK